MNQCDVVVVGGAAVGLLLPPVVIKAIAYLRVTELEVGSGYSYCLFNLTCFR